MQSPSLSTEVLYRPMTLRDVPDLVAIDLTWEGSRWNREAFERELHLPMSVSAVAELAGGPVGFGIMWTVADTAQVLEFAVAPAHRRRGIGRGLMNYLMETARLRGCVRIELELHESNCAAQSFYESQSFATAGRRRRFYDMGRGLMCDALLMERAL